MEEMTTTGGGLGADIKAKMKFSGKVVKIGLAGALIDIGAPVKAVLHISQLLTTGEGEAPRRVEDVLKAGQEIDVWVRRIREDHVELTMIKPLDFEWRDIKKDVKVKGTVVRIEKFGAFVDFGAERPGLVHISEMAHGYVRSPQDVVKEGDEIEAVILDVNRKKKQIKLSLKALQPEPVVEETPRTAAFESRAEAAGANRERVAAKRPKKKTGKDRERGDGGGEFLASYEGNEEGEGEAEPTAMAIALREAMDKAKVRKKQQDEKAHRKGVSEEQEDLLSRTLQNKVQVS